VDVEIKSDAGRIAVLLEQRAARMLDLRPALKNIAAEIDARTAKSIHDSRRQDGVPFPDLADSTKLARLRQRKGAFRKASRLPKDKKSTLRAERRAARSRDYGVWAAGQVARNRRLIQRSGKRSAQIQAAIDAANFKPLLNTGRGANSANARVVGKDSIRWSVVQYMVPHIGGAQNGRPPQRNYSVFRAVGDGFELRPEMSDFIRSAIVRHIAGGAP
jgi:hypothetical protein